ncbi:MAG: CBS domain-containing protein [Spirochaetaceae bacterium]|nr:MAG: CBS domain-containing protein [Spirochaetaceae bacterium]
METTIRDVIRTTGQAVQSVRPDSTVAQALEKMAEHNIGAVLVMGSPDSLSGIFSERDYARAAARSGGVDGATAVSKLMSPELVTVRPEQTVQQCMVFMTERRVRHLPVTDDRGTLVGLVSIGDLVKAAIAEKEYLIAEKQALIGKLQDYISGTIA